jgi:hypothetical protein
MEKRLLDFVIFTIRKMSLADSNFLNYLIPVDQLTADKGLGLDLSSELLLQSEKLFVENALSLLNIPLSINLRYGENVTPQVLLELQQLISQRQKDLKKAKDMIKTCVSNRVVACYAPFKGNKRAQALKVPIGQLAAQIRGTEHSRPFNPTILLPLCGASSFPSSLVAGSGEEQVAELVNQVKQSLLSRGVHQDIAASLSTGYGQYLSEYISQE